MFFCFAFLSIGFFFFFFCDMIFMDTYRLSSFISRSSHTDVSASISGVHYFFEAISGAFVFLFLMFFVQNHIRIKNYTNNAIGCILFKKTDSQIKGLTGGVIDGVFGIFTREKVVASMLKIASTISANKRRPVTIS